MKSSSKGVPSGPPARGRRPSRKDGFSDSQQRAGRSRTVAAALPHAGPLPPFPFPPRAAPECNKGRGADCDAANHWWRGGGDRERGVPRGFGGSGRGRGKGGEGASNGRATGPPWGAPPPPGTGRTDRPLIAGADAGSLSAVPVDGAQGWWYSTLVFQGDTPGALSVTVYRGSFFASRAPESGQG